MIRHMFARTGTTLIATLLSTVAFLASTNGAGAQADPRVGLRGGFQNAAEAAQNLVLIGHQPRPQGFFYPDSIGAFPVANSDLAFRGNYVFQGSFHGFQIWDVSNPSSPAIRTAFACPGGQGDPSVYRNLLFISVEQTNGRLDCGSQGVSDTVSAERFRGVRIFDISDLDHPRQVAAVQTCRGSHTHTLVADPKNPGVVYVYVSGTGPVRSPNELAGCSGLPPAKDTSTALFRIDIIRVPLSAPQNARIVNSPRIFADSTGAIAGLSKGGTTGPGTQTQSETSRCHDITVYSAIGLAAGACAGNGILLDIRDPVHPKRVAEASDPNFAFWHSATFNNDGTKVVFTDEWGGGTLPKCRATDNPLWGADAIFTISGHQLTENRYYKLPAPQTEQENCVAHNGSLIPVPGRDIMAQGWYQGGVSVFDFTDPAHPEEIAYFDRGPLDSTTLLLGGEWAAYWYNGHLYASEIARGLDVFDLKPSEFLSQNEIDAAKLVHLDLFNPQNQQKIVWPASFVVARAYLDQLIRNNGIDGSRSSAIAASLDRAEKLRGAGRRAALNRLAAALDRDARTAADSARVRQMAAAVRGLAKA
jgi:LVIVD repeat